MERRALRVEVAIDGAQRRMKELRRRERQLITLRRRSRLPWAAPIQPLAGAPGAAELLVQIIGNPGSQCTRPRLVRGDQPLAGRLDEEHLRGVEEEVGGVGLLGDARGFRGGGGGSGGSQRQKRGGRDYCCSAHGGDKRAPGDFVHDGLHLLCAEYTTLDRFFDLSGSAVASSKSVSAGHGATDSGRLRQ